MADISDVMQTIAENLVTPIYPDGLLEPSVCGVQVTIETGWPIRSQLDKDLSDGKAHVSVFPTNKERVMTKFERNFQSLTFTAPTITLTVSGQTVTVDGTIQVPQTVMLIVNGIGYAYAIQESDTVDSIATNTAALISGASAVGNIITISSAFRLVARLSTPYTASQEIARVDRVFMISCWCPTPQIRAILGPAIDVYMKQNFKIILLDNYYAQVFYDSTGYIDSLEKQRIYREDLNYKIQYATTVTEEFYSIADPYVNSISFND